MENVTLVVELPGAKLTTQGSEAHNEKMVRIFAELVQEASSGERRKVTSLVIAEKQFDEEVDSAASVSRKSPVDSILLDRIYNIEDEMISLNALPKGENPNHAAEEALMLLLYGYIKLGNRTVVSSIELARAARKSGVPITDRISPILDRAKQFITVAGSTKARRYGLNNPGLRHVEEVSIKLVFD